jgi:hypothetical protein
VGAGEIEGFGRGETRNEAIGDFRRGHQRWRMAGPTKHEVAMDLIGAEDQVAFNAERRERADLARRPRGAARIVRVAEEHDLGARRQLGLEPVEVHHVAAVGFDELGVEDAAAVGNDDAAEGVIGGREDDDLVAGLAHGLEGEAEAGDDAGRRAHPARIDRQLVPARQPIGERLGPGAGIGVVAVDAALDHLLERGGDARRGGKIHVRDPHRNRVWRRDAGKLRHVIPLRRVRAAALDDAIEIEHEAGDPGG